jgi:hypothetical protein
MPVTYRIDGGLAEMLLEGECPPDEVIQTFHRILDDPACPAKFALLLDVSGSTTLATRATDEIIRVASYIGPFRDRVHRCAVVATEDVQFGLSRLGAVYSESAGVMTSTFRDRGEALEWLRPEITEGS